MYIPSAIPKGPRAKRNQGFPFPAQRFRQGPRVAYNVVFPMTALSQMIDIDKIGAKDNDINREVKKPHLQGCELYLEQEPEYVLGGLVLAAAAHQVAFKAHDDATDRLLQEFDEKYQEAGESKDDAKRRTLAAELDEINDKIDVCPGILWIPYGVRLEVTDGQHRIKAILNRIKDKGDAALTHASQGIAAMLIIEPRFQKRQQDFVDLGQTAPIQPTIKVHMDYRQPVTKLVKDMVENVPIFAEQFIELKRPSIRKGTTNIYSLSNLKIAVQAMLLANTRLGAAEAQRRLTEKLDGPNYDRLRDLVVDYFSRLSQEVGCFRDILEDPDSADYDKARDTYMCLNSIGLAVMGMVGHEVVLGRATVERAVEAVAKIDWSRNNPLWEGTLRVGPGVARGGNVIELGGSIVKAVGGLPLTARDVERLRAVDGLGKKLPEGCLETPPVSDLVEGAEAQGVSTEHNQDSGQLVGTVADGQHRHGSVFDFDEDEETRS
jgi:DNA sulfur modification protein DndB